MSIKYGLLSPTSSRTSQSDSSSRSEWFKKSVLFWSNGSDDSSQTNNSVNQSPRVRSKKRTKNLDRIAEKNAASSKRTEIIKIRNNDKDVTKSNEHIQKTTINSKLSSHQSQNPKDRKSTEITDDLESSNNTKESKNEINFDPSDLLRQVQQLERCFRQTPTRMYDSECNRDAGKGEKQSSSPHLTWEFPDGSSIRDNPLYIRAEDIRSRRNKNKLEGLRYSPNNIAINGDNTRKDGSTEEDWRYNIDTSFDNIDILVNIAETAVLNQKHKLKKSFDGENEMRGTEEIVELRQDAEEGRLSVLEIEGCIEQSTPRADMTETLINGQNTLCVDNNNMITMETTIDDDIILNGGKGEIFTKSIDVVDHIKEMESDNVFLSKVNKTNSAKKNNPVKQTFNESDKIIIANSSVCSKRSDNHIIDSIQKVQNTLLEISREIHSSKKTRCGRDPNIVLQTILSDIKPPKDVLPEANRKTFNCQKSIAEKDIDAKEEGIDMATSLGFYAECTTEKTVKDSQRSDMNGGELLRPMDCLTKTENSNKPVVKEKPKCVSHYAAKFERIDSGLHSASSDSTSPYPSPNAYRVSLIANADDRHSNTYEVSNVSLLGHTETIFESLLEYDEMFDKDSYSSSDWSPVSTLESITSSTRSRSNSMPRSTTASRIPLLPEKQLQGNASMWNSNILNNSKVYNDNELKAIRKFLTLTSQCLNRDDVIVDPIQSLEELSCIPGIRASIEKQRKELLQQRAKQKELLQQIGDLLLEVVTLKDEHTTVRTKQAKALSLLKKQLDLMRKHQSKAHTEVVTQVNDINERLNSSLADYPMSNCSTPLNSPKMVTPRNIVSHSRNLSKNHGQIIWKVSDVMKKLTRIKSGLIDAAIVSNPFQTSEYGYKMNSWIYLNGRGKTVGKYISVYVCVLVGEYDAIMPWPIRPCYKFTLIDQKSDITKRNDYCRVRNVFDIAGKGANVLSQNGGIPRPSDGTKALIVGFDDFISHEQLLERRYLADDVFFLKVEAEVSYDA